LQIKGLLEVVKGNTVSGWCYAKDSETPVVVKLYVDDIFIRSRRADNERADIVRGGGGLLSGFNFHINPRLLECLPSAGVVRVLAGDQNFELPLMKGKSSIIEGGASDGGAGLKAMLAGKYHIDHWGNLQIAFGKEPGKREQMLDFYCDLRSLFRSEEGLDIYLTGGNLLGIIRDFGFLDHDDDVDAAFSVRAETPAEAADRFFEIFGSLAPKLYALGYEILLVDVGQFHIFKRGRTGLDVFLGWTTSKKYWYRFIGAGGYLGADEMRVREIEYLGRRVLIPQYAERELDLTYGDNWKDPDPHFFWTLAPEIKAVIQELKQAGRERLLAWQELLKSPEQLYPKRSK